MGGLQQESDGRAAMEQRLLQRAMSEVTELQAAILAEKKAREDTEEAMLRMMEDIVGNLQDELEKEASERKKSEQEMLDILGSTVSHMSRVDSENSSKVAQVRSS